MKRGPLLIAICSFIVVAALAAWPVLRIARSLEQGRESARDAFFELRRATLNLVDDPADAVGADWRAEAGSAWKNQDRLLALILRDGTGEVVYAKPGSSPYYTRTTGELDFERPEGTTVRFGGPLSAGMTMEALYVTLSQEAVFYPVRDAVVVFAAVLAILVAWLLVLSNMAQPTARAADGPATEPPEPRGGPVADDWVPGIPDMLPEESPLYTETPFVPDDDSLFIRASGPTPKARPETVTESPPASAPNGLAYPGGAAAPPSPIPPGAPEATGAATAPKPAIMRPADLPEGALDGPRGLFDAESGLGWEAYLRERLSAELRRSASFEQDLSLLITSMDGAKRGDEKFNLYAATVRDFFSFKDMAFLFGDGGAALILPNMDVDHALRMSEELQKKLSLLFRSRAKHGNPGIAIGLSSRAGRLVDADRIISEAMAAIVKAKGDAGSRIVAFKPDPEKFRAYLAGQ